MSDLGCSMQTLSCSKHAGSGSLNWIQAGFSALGMLSAAKQALNVYISYPDPKLV